MEYNLYSVLHSWFYKQHQLGVRIVENESETKLKIVCKSSVYYYDVIGRPDGAQPNDADSFYDDLIGKYQNKRDKKTAFDLSNKDRSDLEEEIALFLFRALAFYRLHEYYFCEKDLLFAINSLEFIIKNSSDSIIKNHYSKYVDIIILIYQKNLSLLFNKNNDVEGSSFALKLAKKTLQQMLAKGSNYEFYFSEKDLKAISVFVLDHVERTPSAVSDNMFLQLVQQPTLVK
ncbi:hypothetical protein JXO59_15465 [candidate division KSB1 bacterium]|nr:hypothetical protein [candidate division KSB1 bacterium]